MKYRYVISYAVIGTVEAGSADEARDKGVTDANMQLATKGTDALIYVDRDVSYAEDRYAVREENGEHGSN